jgi:glycosyltransferase involved in cell wall biosynthesis
LNLHGRQPSILRPPQDFTVGYFTRIAPEKGLLLLAEAFHLLREVNPGVECRLHVAGYLSPADREYFDAVRRRIESLGLSDVFHYAGETDLAGKVHFLEGLDVFSVPTTYAEPKGIYVLEALAAGVPVVQPRHGVFPELIEQTGGGVLFEPGDAGSLAEALGGLLRDEPARRRMGEAGRRAVHEVYGADKMAEAMYEVLAAHVSGQTVRPLVTPGGRF